MDGDAYRLVNEHYEGRHFYFRWSVVRADGSLVFRTCEKRLANQILRKLLGLEPPPAAWRAG